MRQQSCGMTHEIAPRKLAELRSRGSDALVEELLCKFIGSSTGLLAQAKSALTSGNATQVDFCVHTLKGGALSIGLTEMVNLLSEKFTIN